MLQLYPPLSLSQIWRPLVEAAQESVRRKVPTPVIDERNNDGVCQRQDNDQTVNPALVIDFGGSLVPN